MLHNGKVMMREGRKAGWKEGDMETGEKGRKEGGGKAGEKSREG